MLQTNRANLKEWQEMQRKGILRYQESQRKRNLEKLKAGTLYQKKDNSLKINKVRIDKNISWYKKILWRWFSQYIRLRDSDENGICTCITCGRKHRWNGGQIDAGHYIPKNKGNAIYFDEQDVNAQCKYCNKYLHGNIGSYIIAIDKKYGPGTATTLELKSREIKSFTIDELIEKINYYKVKTKELLLTKPNEK